MYMMKLAFTFIDSLFRSPRSCGKKATQKDACDELCFLNTIVRNPQEVSVLGFPKSKSESRGPYLKDNPNFSKKLRSFFKEGPLSPDFWFGNHPTKKLR